MATKTIQTKVILGEGSDDFFKEVDFDFGNDKLFMIEEVHKWVEVYDAKVVGGNKVIFNAWVYKNLAYKTVECPPEVDCQGNVTVKGDVKHVTKKIPLAGCIAIDAEGVVLTSNDIAEVLSAEVLGDVEELLCPEKISEHPCVFVYGKLHEKMCIRVSVKVVRWEHVELSVGGGNGQRKCGC